MSLMSTSVRWIEADSKDTDVKGLPCVTQAPSFGFEHRRYFKLQVKVKGKWVDVPVKKLP